MKDFSGFKPVIGYIVFVLGCMTSVSALDIYGITLDTDGSYTEAGVSSVTGAGVKQGSNLPSLFSSGSLSDISTGSASKLYVRRTKETYVKYYVKCIGGLVGSGSTYTLTYSLDSGITKTVGSSYTQSSNPFVLIEGLEDGSHSLQVTCTENKASISTTSPASSTTESDPLVFNWVVDTSGNPTVKFDSDPPDITNQNQNTLFFSGSLAASSYISAIAWNYSLVNYGSDPSYVAGSCVSQACTHTVGMSNYDDGRWSFKAQVTYTYFTDCTSSGSVYYCTDLPQKSGLKGTSWYLDRIKPELAITSTPAAKSQYTSGKTAKFEFACKAGEISCTYKCKFDGKNSADSSDNGAELGWFDCTSPLRLTVKNSTTHSFRAYATDAAGNDSPVSDLYMFYSDGTPPIVEFTKVDNSVHFTAQQLASGSTYYANNNDYSLAGGRLYTSAGALADLDEVNGNNNDTSSSAASTTVVQFTCATTTCTSTCGNPCSTSTYATVNTNYHTVVQFPYDPTAAVYELSGTYGAILAMKSVNGLYYYNVLDTTNADFGTITYRCVHSEMA
mmetsp:Transcript_14280/g.19691  ORF Transcript_14280/g.19691 Transcript_14280/m.19691 type:complete len:558 (+) Transcript_14280:81-1754(+)|eukprot:CAMPEP_0196589318 /NCGR_PEP_ID=MMETSP1081-20130531/63254_1 /TAXON_ID=36882 /ORGANISM="Pyramimonas amylifera, Strain CCMP720" /LENGTH=557 /DNA_ID=CAMNT_0041912083 /DNA_START=61 /DNA_END=1734 /DNA_ORIENTATION=+